jgi:hypothetical protein
LRDRGVRFGGRTELTPPHVTRSSELQCTNATGLPSFCVFDLQDHDAFAIHVRARFWRSSIYNVEPGGIPNEQCETEPTAARRRTSDADVFARRAAVRRACACIGAAQGGDRASRHTEAGRPARAAPNHATAPRPAPIRCCSHRRGCLKRHRSRASRRTDEVDASPERRTRCLLEQLRVGGHGFDPRTLQSKNERRLAGTSLGGSHGRSCERNRYRSGCRSANSAGGMSPSDSCSLALLNQPRYSTIARWSWERLRARRGRRSARSRSCRRTIRRARCPRRPRRFRRSERGFDSRRLHFFAHRASYDAPRGETPSMSRTTAAAAVRVWTSSFA